MRLRKRILYLRQPKAAVRRSMYGLICNDLQKALQRWSGQDESIFATWPTLTWQSEKKQIVVSAWLSTEQIDHRLLTVELTECVNALTWTISLRIGSTNDEEIVIQEECHLKPATAQVPIADIPDILDFLPTYDCVDEDGLYAGKVYGIALDRAQAFADFISAPSSERKLPVVLISPDNTSKEYLLPCQELAIRLSGLAHVMTLSSQATWYSKHLPLPHPCFNGAVRLYLPGYTPADDSSIHRYYRSELLKEKPAEVIYEEIQRLLINWPFDKESDTIIALNRLRTEEANQRHLNREIEAIQQRIRHEAETQATVQLETLWQGLLTDAEKLSQDYNRITTENGLLKQQLKERDDQIRHLNRRLKQQWVDEEDLPAQLEAPTPQLYLSKRAYAAYTSMDQGLRHEIDNQILRKLCDPSLRANQTEPVAARNGACFVFPRSDSAAGRRVIYRLADDCVHICELYLHHDAYNHARDRGFDLTDYADFTPWSPNTSLLADIAI
ncbi:MAG: hypothetical protein ACOYNY_21785 [Caldilineaceae bacterium]